MMIPNTVFCQVCGKELLTIQTDLNNRLSRNITAQCAKHQTTTQGVGRST